MSTVTTRRRFITTGAGGLLGAGLAACGGDQPDHVQGVTRLVEGAYGKVRLPSHPTRVVALGKAAIQTMFDVGITPVGVDADEAPIMIPAYRKRVATIPTVGTYGDFSVEQIAALKPDLVISFDTYIGRSLYARLHEFSPAYVLKTDAGEIPWQQATAAFANAVDRNDTLEALRHRYFTRLQQLRSQYHAVLHANRWEIVQTANPGTYYRYLPSSDPSQILAALGATLGNAGATGPNYWGPTLSYETIDARLGHATVVLAVEVGEQPLLAAPTFKALPAAEAGHVYSSNLLFPASYSGALDLLDFIEDVCRKLNS